MMQKFTDPPLTQCPECYKDTVVKLVSAPGFQLKGSGWYATDFKDKKSGTEKNETKKTDSTTSDNAKDTSSSKVSKTTSDGEGT